MAGWIGLPFCSLFSSYVPSFHFFVIVLLYNLVSVKLVVNKFIYFLLADKRRLRVVRKISDYLLT